MEHHYNQGGYAAQHAFAENQVFINGDVAHWNHDQTSPYALSVSSPFSYGSQVSSSPNGSAPSVEWCNNDHAAQDYAYFPHQTDSLDEDFDVALELIQQDASISCLSSPSGNITAHGSSLNSAPSCSGENEQLVDAVPHTPKKPRKYKAKPAQIKATKEYEIKRARNYDAVSKNREAAAEREPKRLQRLDYLEKLVEYIMIHNVITLPTNAELGVGEGYGSDKFVPTSSELKKMKSSQR